MSDRQRLAEGFAALKAAAEGHPMRDKLTAWVIDGGDEGDLALLLGFAVAEAAFNTPCQRCGYQPAHDIVQEVQDAMLDQLLDERKKRTWRPVHAKP